MTHSKVTGYVALAAVCLFWGTTFLTIRMALELFSPAVLIAVRYFLSGGILLLTARLRGTHIPQGRELILTALCGLLIIGGGNGALVWAEKLIPSGLASLFNTIQPFWFVIFEALLPGGARLHGPTILGMLVGLSGAALLLAPTGSSGHFDGNALLGFVILQCGCVAWCFGSILQRRLRTRAHPIVSGAIQQLGASISFVPLALLLPHGPIPHDPWTTRTRALWALAYLVVFGSIVGYSAYIYVMSTLPVALASIYPYVNAVVAVILGWIFYREPFGWRELAAMLIIFTGVGIVKWQSARAESSRQVLRETAPATE